MRYKMSKKVNEIIISFQKRLKMIKPFDSIIVFILIMGHYDFGVFQSIAIIMYIVYKIYSNKSNFNNKVALS